MIYSLQQQRQHAGPCSRIGLLLARGNIDGSNDHRTHDHGGLHAGHDSGLCSEYLVSELAMSS